MPFSPLAVACLSRSFGIHSTGRQVPGTFDVHTLLPQEAEARLAQAGLEALVALLVNRLKLLGVYNLGCCL